MSNNTTQPNKYIFCFLDILGYKEIVEMHGNNLEKIQLIEKFFEQVFFTYKNSLTKRGETENEHLVKVFNQIHINVISDSIFIRMPLNNLPMLPHNFGDGYNTIVYIEMFCDFICSLFYTFSSKFGYFLRGGISINSHYEGDMNGNGLFIFSRALIDAYLLEQKKPHEIKIIVHQNVSEFIENTYDKDNREYFNSNYLFKDSHDDYCLSLYKSFTNLEEVRMILKNFNEILVHQITNHKHTDSILVKYKPFIEYHNKFLTDKLKTNEYYIDYNSVINN